MTRAHLLALAVAALTVHGPAKLEAERAKTCKKLSDCAKGQVCVTERGKPKGTCVSRCEAELKDLKTYCRATQDCARGEECLGCFPDPCQPKVPACRTRCVKSDQRKALAAKGKTCDPAREDHRQYSGRDADACRKKQPPCPKGSVPFQNDCGCGCAQSQSCPKWVNCMPGPDVKVPCGRPAGCPFTSIAE